MLKDLVLKNRSYRGYDETRKVTKEELTELIELARLTPSGMNLQPLKYYISCETEEVERILKQTKWGGALPEYNLPHDGMHPAAFIVICHDKNLAPNDDASQKDVGIVAQTMLLGAVEKNLGGLMIGAFNKDGVIAEIGLPENLVPKLILAIGKPAENICLVDIKEDGSFKYYRDEQENHFVPKRSLDELIINN